MKKGKQTTSSLSHSSHAKSSKHLVFTVFAGRSLAKKQRGLKNRCAHDLFMRTLNLVTLVFAQLLAIESHVKERFFMSFDLRGTHVPAIRVSPCMLWLGYGYLYRRCLQPVRANSKIAVFANDVVRSWQNRGIPESILADGVVARLRPN